MRSRIARPSSFLSRVRALVPNDHTFFEVDHRFSDVSGVVADPLEMTADAQQLQPGLELTGVSAERVLRLSAESTMEPIDRAITIDHGPGLLGVSRDKGVVARPSLIEHVACK